MVGMRRKEQVKWAGLVPLLAAVAVLAIPASPASATHFRFGHVTWKPASSGPANTIEFTATLGYRRSFYNGSHPDGDPQPGDVITVDPLNFGDSNSQALMATVTDYSISEDWILAQATVTHTYASAQAYTAAIDSGNRLSPCSTGTAHLNNPDGTYRVETRVDVGSGNSSPVSCLPPIVRCPQGAPCSFQIPTSDNEDDPLTFSLSTQAQSAIAVQPGAGNSCTGGVASVSSSGVYSWNSAGCSLASGACSRSFYSTQVTMQESAGNAKSAIDFFVQLVSCPPSDAPPVFGSSTPCGMILSTTPGETVTFPVDVSDENSLDVTTATSACVPVDSSTVPSLPLSGNPVSTTFAWTPTAADIGQHVMTFSAIDQCGQQTLCPVTIDVSEEICDNGGDDDGDSLADCDDPDCAGFPTCVPTPTEVPTATFVPTDTDTPAPTDTPTPDPTDTDTPTTTPTTTPTSTATATSTSTATATSTNTIPPGGSAFILRKLQLKANTSSRRPNGRMNARGILDVNRPFEMFSADVIANGLTFRFTTGALVENVSFAAGECVAKEPRPGRLSIRCASADKNRLARFRPVSGLIAPNVFQVGVVAKRRTFLPPMTAAPVTVVIDVSDPDPADTIGELGTCKLNGSQSQKLKCQEKGILSY